jgi:Fe-S-cluster containining protein
MKGTNDHPLRCVALSGEVGSQVACAIYESRPAPCREFNVFEEDGSPNERCQRLRAGIPGV